MANAGCCRVRVVLVIVVVLGSWPRPLAGPGGYLRRWGVWCGRGYGLVSQLGGVLNPEGQVSYSIRSRDWTFGEGRVRGHSKPHPPR